MSGLEFRFKRGTHDLFILFIAPSKALRGDFLMLDPNFCHLVDRDVCSLSRRELMVVKDPFLSLVQ